MRRSTPTCCAGGLRRPAHQLDRRRAELGRLVSTFPAGSCWSRAGLGDGLELLLAATSSAAGCAGRTAPCRSGSRRRWSMRPLGGGHRGDLVEQVAPPSRRNPRACRMLKLTRARGSRPSGGPCCLRSALGIGARLVGQPGHGAKIGAFVEGASSRAIAASSVSSAITISRM